MLGAISAVFLSWESKRAKIYRKLNHIPAEWGTAVNVQSMVFGNMGNDCATGVVFTRNPSDGSNNIYGEYLINAQGEDVVAGTRTPQYITKKAKQLGITQEALATKKDILLLVQGRDSRLNVGWRKSQLNKGIKKILN